MYESIVSKFKSNLIDRKLDIRMFCTAFAILALYLITITTTWVIYKSQLIFGLVSCIFITIALISLYIVFVKTATKNSNIKTKDFLNHKKISIYIKNTNRKDIDILQTILEEFGINTEQKIQVAIDHYSSLLQQKPMANFTITSIISIVIAVFGIVFSFYKGGLNNVIPLVIILATAIAIVGILCYAFKLIYKNCIYNLTEYAVYERIKTALSEILITKLP